MARKRVMVREGQAGYHAMVEIDRGTMSLPRLGRKLSLYLGWAASGVWRERHPFVPALLVVTTPPRRVEQIVARAEERCRTEARRCRASRRPGASGASWSRRAMPWNARRPRWPIRSGRPADGSRAFAFPTCSEGPGSCGVPSSRGEGSRSSRPAGATRRSWRTWRAFDGPSKRSPVGGTRSTLSPSRETGGGRAGRAAAAAGGLTPDVGAGGAGLPVLLAPDRTG